VNARDLRVHAITGIGGRLLDGLLRTVRFETGGASNYQREWDAGRPVIFTLWHGRLLPLSWFHRAWNLVTLISASSDGEYIARVVQRWGYDVVRGSSSRGGGRALRELIGQLRAGRSVAVTPDGPRGPRERLKPGVLVAAQLTGLALLPVSAGADHAWWFEGWDRFMVPRPFARVRILYGEPVFVPRDADAGQLDEITRTVETAVSGLTTQAEAELRD
jgi:lysophospholipid acyltransferase (LPLAT)-like uncharacterized protein